MFDGKFRQQVERVVRPVGEQLRRTKLSPDHLTLIGLLVACFAAVAIALENCKWVCCSLFSLRCQICWMAHLPKHPIKAANVVLF